MDKETITNNAKDAKIHNTTNTMAKLNINSNNSNTTPSLNSDGEQQSSQESTVTTKTKVNHTKAQKIYHDLDPQGKIYNNVLKEMKEHIWLHDCARQIGNKLANNSKINFDLDVLKENIIATAEAIHQGLQNEELKNKFCDNDDLDQKSLADDSDNYLFTIALNNLCFALKDNQAEIIGSIDEIYGIE